MKRGEGRVGLSTSVRRANKVYPCPAHLPVDDEWGRNGRGPSPTSKKWPPKTFDEHDWDMGGKAE